MIAVPILVVCAAFATVSAATFRSHDDPGIDPHFLVGSGENREHLRILFSMLDLQGNSPEENFAVIREISNNFFREGEYGRLIRFLGERTVRFPDDPYNGHHLLMIAYAYMRQGSLPIAARYFDLIVKNYPDQPEDVRINLIVHKNKVIGGDVCSLSLDGFIHGFTIP